MIKYLALFILIYSVQSNAQNWNLVWSDEFSDSTINKTNWTYDIGAGGWGNNELEYYTSRPQNASIKNGSLQIVARNESYGGSSYTSARMKTQGLRNFQYGKIEARIKIPVGQGIWPAFWMLGSNITQVGWPKCGELDIMEHINNSYLINGTMHWDNNGHVQYGAGTPSLPLTEYHIYSIEWNDKSIKWFLDGNKYLDANIANNINSTDELHGSAFIILNLAVGGNWPGNPNSTTTFPDTMLVDYVRVYQLATDIGSDSGKLIPEKYSLHQNYPNPFNPVTKISFSVPKESFVSLKIFNALGKEVAELVKEVKRAGNHNIEFNAAGLPTGIYLCRMTTDKFLETKKLLLLK